MLHNFGQNITLSGNATSVANDPSSALKDENSGKMMGIGLTPEGIGHTPIIYSLMLENVWNEGNPVDINSFIERYCTNRYGKKHAATIQAWKEIFAFAFENTSNNGGHESIITGRPTFKKNPGGCTNTNASYNLKDLVLAWEKLYSGCADLSGSDGFRYDIVDITRQVLADYASVIQCKFAYDYNHDDREAFEIDSKYFLDLIDNIDELLASRKEFLLGPWLESAKSLGDTEEESNLYERNARNLLSTWGNKDCKLNDYACRQWSGMMKDYYKKRWELFFSEVKSNWGNYKDETFAQKAKEMEWAWIGERQVYTTKAKGDEIKIVKKLYKKYHQDISATLCNLH